MLEKESVDTKVKIKHLKHVSEKYMEQSFYEGVIPRVLEEGKEVAENICKLVSQEDRLSEVLQNYQDLEPEFYDHSFLVTLFSTAIIKQFSMAVSEND